MAVENLAVGYPSLLHVDLRVELIQPAEAYLVENWQRDVDESRDDIKACRSLIDLAAEIAEQIEDQFPFLEGAGEGYAQRLRAAWSTFIERTAAPELIHSRAQRSRAAADSASRPRKSRTSSLTGELLTGDMLLSRIQKGAEAGQRKKTVLGSLSIEFGVSVRQLERDLKAIAERD